MQAIDRAHRIGQKKSVQVFRLITLNSIEEKMFNLQIFKNYIANNVVDANKISETNINTDSIFQSFENFAADKIDAEIEEKEKERSREKKHMSKLERIMEVGEEKMRENEMQYESVKKLLGKSQE